VGGLGENVAALSPHTSNVTPGKKPAAPSVKVRPGSEPGQTNDAEDSDFLVFCFAKAEDAAVLPSASVERLAGEWTMTGPRLTPERDGAGEQAGADQVRLPGEGLLAVVEHVDERPSHVCFAAIL